MLRAAFASHFGLFSWPARREDVSFCTTLKASSGRALERQGLSSSLLNRVFQSHIPVCFSECCPGINLYEATSGNQCSLWHLPQKISDHSIRLAALLPRTWITSISAAWTAKRYGKPVIAIGGCLSSDVGVVYDHGIDAVFSVLSQICTVDEALAHAAENVKSASRNIAMAIKIAEEIRT